MTTSRFDRGHEVIVGIEVSWIFVACLPPRAGWCIIYTWPRVSHTSSSPEWRIIDGGIHASTTLRHQVLRGIRLSRRYRFDFYIRIHDPRTASIHSFASVRAAPPRRSNKFDRGAFRFLHSMIDRSIDRWFFPSIFKSNYFFFYENNKNTKNDLSWNLFFFNITIKFFSTGDEFFIGIFWEDM